MMAMTTREREKQKQHSIERENSVLKVQTRERKKAAYGSTKKAAAVVRCGV